MALPIESTPKLNKKESKIFLKNIIADLKKPMRRKPTPKLDQAVKKISEYYAR